MKPLLRIGTATTFAAKNLATGRVVEGAMRPVSAGSLAKPPSDHDFAARIQPGQAVGGYFNPNLANLVALPAEAARYEVYAYWGDTESNRVVIELIAR
ncbi:hypothetical protein [Acanthopleuribacter pedis]|uniref:Uncharacterized protein n=1 Tax=Acanthopleuribacter pedis TaxID=442870 RepID=A0A8J7QMY7_9BACT|nr:hypothetical protein [Acanthopleuribacter pedis]MBO1321368.1 hypothetical protein [Acanthopleuribacter pedis]